MGQATPTAGPVENLLEPEVLVVPLTSSYEVVLGDQVICRLNYDGTDKVNIDRGNINQLREISLREIQKERVERFPLDGPRTLIIRLIRRTDLTVQVKASLITRTQYDGPSLIEGQRWEQKLVVQTGNKTACLIQNQVSSESLNDASERFEISAVSGMMHQMMQVLIYLGFIQNSNQISSFLGDCRTLISEGSADHCEGLNNALLALTHQHFGKGGLDLARMYALFPILHEPGQTFVVAFKKSFPNLEKDTNKTRSAISGILAPQLGA